MPFKNREDAGKKLAREFKELSRNENVLILALPRGGVPVASEISKRLNTDVDVLIVRKIGVPGYEEFAMGAIGPKGSVYLNNNLIKRLQIPANAIQETIKRERKELQRRMEEYRGKKEDLDVSGKTIILVDDGVATGASMRVAIEVLKKMGPRRIIIAIPVAPEETIEDLKDLVDDVICLETPSPFRAVGLWYHDFHQTSDAEVKELLVTT